MGLNEIKQQLLYKIGTARIEHQAKIDDVKDSLMNKDWVVQGWFQKVVISAGFFSLVWVIIKLLILISSWLR
jgi:hypothetical protein